LAYPDSDKPLVLEDLARRVEVHPGPRQEPEACGCGTPALRAAPTRAHALRAVLEKWAKAHD
jgi:hypothetical protein